MLGAYASWQIQERQFSHERQSRFYALKLEVYSQFSYIVTKYISSVRVGKPDNDIVLQVGEKYNVIRLVGSKAVIDAAKAMHEDFVAALNAKDGEKNSSYLGDLISKHLSAFYQAVRDELEVDLWWKEPKI